MVALDEHFHHNGTKARSRRRKDGFGRYSKSLTASVCSVNSVACNHPNGGVTGNIPNGTTDYIWQGWQTMEERNPYGGSGSTDTPTKQYVWGTYIDECIQLNLLVAAGPQSVPVGAYYLLQDLQFRAVALANSSGQIVEAYDCEAYGNTLIFTGPSPDGLWFTDDDVQASYGTNEIIYCGYRYDPESQLYYVRNRTYNPALGRWLQRDPIGYSGGINLYGYVGGRAVAAHDSSGLAVAIPSSGYGQPPPLPAGVPTLAELMGWLADFAGVDPALIPFLAVIGAAGAYVIWRLNACWPGYEECQLRAHTRSNWCTVVYLPNRGLSRVDELNCLALNEARFEASCAGELAKCLLAFWSGYNQPRMPCRPCPRFCLPSVG